MMIDKFERASKINLNMQKVKIIKNSILAPFDLIDINIHTLNQDNYNFNLKDDFLKDKFVKFLDEVIKELEDEFNEI